jgi:hypothetical protein
VKYVSYWHDTAPAFSGGAEGADTQKSPVAWGWGDGHRTTLQVKLRNETPLGCTIYFGFSIRLRTGVVRHFNAVAAMAMDARRSAPRSKGGRRPVKLTDAGAALFA